ncbi:MAG: eL32 family ribosomal protein [archaeon]|nr:eL32 family ribosomal protein [archaeon]
MIKELLEVRKLMKSKKPSFRRQDSHKHLKLGSSWRGRKGRHNKYRLHRIGATPSPSYGSPVKVRGMHASGKKEIMVYKVSDLDLLQKDEVVRIGASVGVKKRMDILKNAEKLKLKVLNPGIGVLRAIRFVAKKEKDKKKSEVKGKTGKTDAKVGTVEAGKLGNDEEDNKGKKKGKKKAEDKIKEKNK